MLQMELERVFAKRELVRDVIREKIREGMVETPETVLLGASFGLDRMKIWWERQLHYIIPLEGLTYLEYLDEVGYFTVSRHVSLGKSKVSQRDEFQPERIPDHPDVHRLSLPGFWQPQLFPLLIAREDVNPGVGCKDP